ncbi:MAG TPA: fibronectin type III domain-containing protein [Candidatus Nanoarchaeia archaeon]|nr:fibronectin type III domain-containing protein [Candidatus Nanoarchaeia archaeon]
MEKHILVFLVILSFLPIAVAANFVPGDAVQVMGGSLNLRTSGSLSAPIIRAVPAGSIGYALSGPTSNSGYLWWKIRWPEGIEGYMVEQTGSASLTKYVIPLSTKFSMNDRVKVTENQVNIRTDPPELFASGLVSGGTEGTIIAGPNYGVPKSSSGFHWFWKVSLPSGTGWVAEQYLAKVTATTYPPAPTLLSPANGDVVNIDTPRFSWQSVSGATLYRLLVQDSATGQDVYDIFTTETSAVISSGILRSGGNYRWKMQTRNSYGWSGFSSEFLFRVDIAPSASRPTAPILQATAGDRVVQLSWPIPNDGGSPILSYNIYRGPQIGPVTSLATAQGNAYADSSVVNGNTYQYAVTAVNAIGESLLSNTVEATLQSTASTPGIPQNLAATAGDGSIDLTWNEPSNGGSPIIQYAVYYGQNLASRALVSSRSFSQTGLTNGISYSYRVAAINAIGEGDKSATVSAVPQAAGQSIPAIPTGMAPGESTAPGMKVGLTPALTWNAVPGASRYQVYVSKSPYGGENIIYDNTQLIMPSVTLPALAAGTQYRWDVGACNSAGCSVQSEDRYFFTEQVAVSGNFDLSITDMGTNPAAVIPDSAPQFQIIVRNGGSQHLAAPVKINLFKDDALQQTCVLPTGIQAGQSQTCIAVPLTFELLAAIMATLDKEVGGSNYLPVEERGDYGMGLGCSYPINGACRSSPYSGGLDYKGRGYIQITHDYNYRVHCGTECMGTSSPALDICGCKNKLQCSVTDETICPQRRALQPEHAARIFVSYYQANGLISLANRKQYYAVGDGINDATYATSFAQIAENRLSLLNANAANAWKLVQCLSGSGSSCGPSVFPELFTYDTAKNQNLYDALSRIVAALPRQTLSEGTYSIRAVADPDQGITETDETNNERTENLVVSKQCPVIYRTNVVNGQYKDRTWVAVQSDSDPDLDGFGYRTTVTRATSVKAYCKPTLPLLATTPEGYPVRLYTSQWVSVCSNKAFRYYSADADAKNAALSPLPTAPYTANNQERTQCAT